MNSKPEITKDQLYQIALLAAERAAEVIRSHREQGAFKVNFKSERDLVTTADLEAEKAILSVITEHLPEDLILSEESFPTSNLDLPEGRRMWVIDPIDGTTNFAQGHHQVAVSIACAIGKHVEVAVVLAPFQGETFSAIRGQGAYLNGKAIQVSEKTEMTHALIATGFPYKRENVELLGEQLKQILLNCRDIRRLGSAALDLSWVACGRLDGYFESVQPWDMAAGALIAREAGAQVGTFAEDERRGLAADLDGTKLLATSPAFYEPLKKLLKEVAAR